MSMKLALEQLGVGRCYHMAELIADLSRLPLWLRAADGAADWEAVFEGFTATVDYPGCTYWRELAAFYPDAKVLLTVRDPDDWFDSTQATIFSAPMRARIAASPMQGFFAEGGVARFRQQARRSRVHDGQRSSDTTRRFAARFHPSACSCTKWARAGRACASSWASPCPRRRSRASTRARRCSRCWRRRRFAGRLYRRGYGRHGPAAPRRLFEGSAALGAGSRVRPTP